MTDFPLFVPRRGTGAKPLGGVLSLVRGLIAAVARIVERRRARRAMRLPLTHMSDGQLRDIGLRRCGDHLRDNG